MSVQSIGASVGIANGKQCYNVVADQLTIITMLNRLPDFSGGTGGKLGTSPHWGICSGDLHQAILRFQAAYSLSVDGHVDPGGKTIWTLNKALGEQGLAEPAIGKNVPVQSKAFDPVWVVESLSLSTYGFVAGGGGNAYFGNIGLFNGLEGSITRSMKGGGLAVGASAGADAAKVTQGARQIALRVVKAFTDNPILGNSTFAREQDTSLNGGICLPLDPDASLDISSFSGACFGGNLGVGVGSVGGAVWALFFGMPEGFIKGMIAATYAGSTIALTPAALVGLGYMLYQAKGIAFIAGGGRQLSIGGGASLNEFIGVIG